MRFWDVVKEVSTQPVRREADRLFVLALAGHPEAVAQAQALALGAEPAEAPGLRAAAEPFLFPVSPPYNEAQEKRLRHADLVVSLPGGPGPTDFRPADTLCLDQVERLVPEVLARRPDLRLALGRRLPGFRSAAAEQTIREVSRVNAEFAAISGITQSVPLLAPFFPAVAGADILILTKNQVLLIFRLAAIYGEALDLRARAGEVATVIGGAFGWRALARQVAGLVPGLGLPVRAAIAYTGTYAVGRAAQLYFAEGRRPTRQEMRRILEEGAHLARGIAAALKERFRPPAELPPPSGRPRAEESRAGRGSAGE